jgi:hypothetical protein
MCRDEWQTIYEVSGQLQALKANGNLFRGNWNNGMDRAVGNKIPCKETNLES